MTMAEKISLLVFVVAFVAIFGFAFRGEIRKGIGSRRPTERDPHEGGV